ncbi:MAG: GNAT family N-acetyltransferase, partial [Anaerolineae bacterium]|nr:GNAT family N-acetyltransferase [Anaerolineae bacterium]
MNVAGPGNVSIRDVVGQDSPYLPVAVDVFTAIFPDYAHYVPYVRVCALQRSPDHPATLDHVWVVEQDGTPIGIRILSYVHTRNFGHDAFVGLLPAYRGQGIGGWLVEQSLRQIGLDAEQFGQPPPLGYCTEVEPAADAADVAERRERERVLAFHLRHGGVLLDVDYTEPPMIAGVRYFDPQHFTDLSPTPMHLVFYPLQTCRLNRQTLVDVV